MGFLKDCRCTERRAGETAIAPRLLEAGYRHLMQTLSSVIRQHMTEYN
jgi:hypothetical protein